MIINICECSILPNNMHVYYACDDNKFCWKSSWTGLNHKPKRKSLKNRLGSEPEGAPQNRSSTLESCVKSISNISRIRTMSSLISKKPLDRVWHAALWATMRKYNISANLVRTIEQLYDIAASAVLMDGSTGEWFRTTVGERQGCLLSPTLFNIFLERIMSDDLEEHDGKVSIGGRNITNLRFADDIDALAEEKQECRNRSPSWKSRQNLHKI